MAVTWYDAARVEGGPEVIVNVLVGVLGGDGVLHLDDPAEDFLRGETGTQGKVSG